VHTFECEDGTTRGAMSGCIKLFPVHPIAAADMALRERERDLRKRFGRDARLNTWDGTMREAIDRFYRGEVTAEDTQRTIEWQTREKANYRFSRRRR
jgi:hypothetical protein